MTEIKSEIHVGRKTDIWSYGCVVVQMWTGKLPTYPGETSGSSGTVSLDTSTRRPLIPKDMPVELLNFVDQCLLVDADKRPEASQLLNNSFFGAAAANNY